MMTIWYKIHRIKLFLYNLFFTNKSNSNPGVGPYRTAATMEPKLKRKSVNPKISFKKKYPKIFSFGKTIVEIIAGLLVVVLILALFWCLFPGLTLLGYYLNQWYDFNISQQVPESGRDMKMWASGLMTVAFIPIVYIFGKMLKNIGKVVVSGEIFRVW